MGSSLRSWTAIAGLLLAAACGTFTGLALAERASTADTNTLTVTDPHSAEETRTALQSAAGFTGFEGLALAGPVTRTGEVVAGTDGAFSVVSGEATLEVQTTSPARLYRIVPSAVPLSIGDVIVVRLDGSGVPIAVLHVPSDLRKD